MRSLMGIFTMTATKQSLIVLEALTRLQVTDLDGTINQPVWLVSEVISAAVARAARETRRELRRAPK